MRNEIRIGTLEGQSVLRATFAKWRYWMQEADMDLFSCILMQENAMIESSFAIDVDIRRNDS